MNRAIFSKYQVFRIKSNASKETCDLLFVKGYSCMVLGHLLMGIFKILALNLLGFISFF